MIDLKKERKAFEKSLAKKGIELIFIHIVFDDGVYRFSDKFNDQSDFHEDALHEIEVGWESWQQRAELAQQEVEATKRELEFATKTINNLLEKLAKYESDVVVVPREPTLEMLNVGYLHGYGSSTCEVYKAMIEAGEIK